MSPDPLDDSNRFIAKATPDIMTSTFGPDTCVPLDPCVPVDRTEVDIQTAPRQNDSLRLMTCDI